MNAWKAAVLGLLVVVAGLLLTVRRMAQQAAPQAVQTTEAQPATQAAPAVAAVEPAKPSPVISNRRAAKPARNRAPTETSAVAAPVEQPRPAEVAPRREPEPPAAPAPVREVVREPVAPPPPPAPRRVTLPAGTPLVVFERSGQLWIRQQSDGHVDTEAKSLRLGEPVETGGVSLVLEAWKTTGPGAMKT